MNVPFCIGTTSYIIPADLVENARFLAGRVQDMQLVLFEVENGPSNLPGPQIISELAEIGQRLQLSYSVHLLYDLQAHEPDSQESTPELHISLQKAQQIIELTRPLTPYAFVAHLDGREIQAQQQEPAAVAHWQQQRAQALRQVLPWLDRPEQLLVENLEGFAPDLVMPPVLATGVARCVDVGHLWRDGLAPLPILQRTLPWTRLIHLHGVKDGQDHQSLQHMSPQQLDPVIDLLIRQAYHGVLTLEIFGEEDFTSSLVALHESVRRLQG